MEEVWKQEFSLAELIAPEAFKSYDVLKKQLYKVLKLGDPEPTTSGRSSAQAQDFQPNYGEAEAPAGNQAQAHDPVGGDDEEDLSFFKSLSS